MRNIKTPFFFLSISFSVWLWSGIAIKTYAQSPAKNKPDDLITQLQTAKEDSNKLNLYIEILQRHIYQNGQEGLNYEQPALELAKKLNSKIGIASVKNVVGRIYWRMGNFDMAFKNHFESLQLAIEIDDKHFTARVLTFIGQDYGDSGNYDSALVYFNKSIEIYEAIGDKKNISSAYQLVAWVYNNMGNYTEVLKYNYATLNIEEELGDEYTVAIALSNIAESHEKMGNYSEALKFYYKSISGLLNGRDTINAAHVYAGIGDIYKTTENYKAAINAYEYTLKLGYKISDHTVLARAFHGNGDVYLLQNNFEGALDNYKKAFDEYKFFGNKQALASLYSQIGICYSKLNKPEEAKKCFDDALALSQELNSNVSFTNYYGGKHLYDSLTGNWEHAYKNYRRYIVLRDSTFNKDNLKKMLSTQMQYENEKKEAAAKAEQEKKDILQRTIRNSITAALAGSLIFLIVVYRQRNKISKARKRSDELLLNILPEEVAEELKVKGEADAKQIDEVTVMFTDFKGFTSMSEKLTPKELVKDIHECFSAFDHIMEKYGMEKIKTIGDSYMAAGGLPTPNKTHAEDAVKAALEIIQFIAEGKARKIAAGLPYFEIRIGIHTGPVVAGIVGVKKFAYDIWGDTVNTASRMESSGEVGRINISGSTYELVKDKFKCTNRGKIQAKGKGEIDMYFLEAIS